MTTHTWHITQCLHCGHTWNDEDPKAKPCSCLDTHARRDHRMALTSIRPHRYNNT